MAIGASHATTTGSLNPDSYTESFKYLLPLIHTAGGIGLFRTMAQQGYCAICDRRIVRSEVWDSFGQELLKQHHIGNNRVDIFAIFRAESQGHRRVDAHKRYIVQSIRSQQVRMVTGGGTKLLQKTMDV